MKNQICLYGDKSIAHRLVLLSLIVEQEIQIDNFPNSQDVETSLNIVKQLGVKISFDLNNKNKITLVGGLKNKYFTKEITLDCKNSGTTTRLLCGILANLKGKFKLIGDSSLSCRPMERVVKPLSELMKVNIKCHDGHLPIYIEPNGETKSINFFNITGSAQVKSAILFAGLASNNKTIVEEKITSRDHTERLLNYLQLNKEKRSFSFCIPGDISSAAFFVVASLITSKSLIIKNVLLNTTRIGFINVLKRMGANIELKIEKDLWEPIGNIYVKGSNLIATTIKENEIPSLIDELPILAVAMAFAKGTSKVSGASELRVKESDRISCLISQLKIAGVDASEKSDGFEITGPSCIKSTELNSFNDHRLAMSFAVLGYCSKTNLKIKGKESVNISFPDFFKVLKA